MLYIWIACLVIAVGTCGVNIWADFKKVGLPYDQWLRYHRYSFIARLLCMPFAVATGVGIPHVFP